MERVKKIAIVNQRYGLEVNGGSEQLARELAEQLLPFYEVEVLTSCALDYTNWANHYPEGVEEINGVTVRRFPTDKPRGADFGPLTAELLNHHIGDRKREERWMDGLGPHCPGCIAYMREHESEYSAFLFVTYLYYLTARGLPAVQDKAVLIPTAHDEPYIRMGIYKDIFCKPRAIGYLTDDEQAFVHALFHNRDVPNDILGMGVVVPESPDPEGFKAKHKLDEYLLYVGRIDEGKNCPALFYDFLRYKQDNPDSKLKLVLMGKAVIPVLSHPDIIPLGFVTEEEKYDGMAGARMLVMPSEYESLSIVVLESLALGVPVVVNETCKVLKGHCIKSNAGLYYSSYHEFAGVLDYLLTHPAQYTQMGKNGKAYVEANYQWPVIIDKLCRLIEIAEQ